MYNYICVERFFLIIQKCLPCLKQDNVCYGAGKRQPQGRGGNTVESSHWWEKEGLSEMAGNQGVRREVVSLLG